MQINDLIKITRGYFVNLPEGNPSISSFKLDSRKITKGDVFICINSGTDYIEDAINNGAVGIISEKKIYSNTNTAIIKVSSIKDTLLCLGSYIRNKYKDIPLVAITGSVGKSSTKALIYNILSKEYKVLQNKGNHNNYIGVTETLFELDNSYDIIIMELGMNHFHEIEEMSLMLKPDMCAITNIGTSHIGNLGSQKNIFKAKMEIVTGMNNGYLVIPPDDKYLRKLKGNNICKCYDIDINHIVLNDRLRFDLKYNNLTYNIRFNVPNKKYIDNILVAFKICTLFDIDVNTIIKGINDFNPLESRMNIKDIHNFTLIDDCYNSSYESLDGVLDYIKKQNKESLIILGDILELGPFSKKIHQKVQKKLKKIKNKEVLLVGNDTKYIDGTHFNTNNDIIYYLKDRDLSNYIVLIKGSRKMNLEEIKEQLIGN